MQGTMALKDILKTHRTWEDGVSLVLGLMIGLSPWFYDEPAVPTVLLNSGLTGLAVLALAQLELIRLRRWEEIAQLACGLWLSASPFIFDYFHQDCPHRVIPSSCSDRSRAVVTIDPEHPFRGIPISLWSSGRSMTATVG